MSSDTSFTAAKTKSTSTFLSAFVIAATVRRFLSTPAILIANSTIVRLTQVAGIQLVIFLLLRTSIKKVYSPRTYLPVPSKRSQPVSSAPWGWLLPTIRAPSVQMIPTAGLDAFMYLRFLKMMIYIFAPTSCLTFAVLLPLDAVGTHLTTTGLNSFSFGNIPTNLQIRYVGHLLCAYAVTFWVIYLVQKEMSNYIRLRQNYLTSQHHIDLPQCRTVLVTGVPKKYLSTSALKKLTASLPGGIRRVWLSRELKRLPDLYNDRLKCTSMLESAETELCRAAIKHNKHLISSQSSRRPSSSIIPTTLRQGTSPDSDQRQPQHQHNGDPVNRLVSNKLRPTHRLGFWGMCGKKVDTVEWCKDEIVRLTKEIEEARRSIDRQPPHNSAFIEFNDRLAAQIFSQIALHQQPLRMAKRYVDAAPEDIIWDNLNVNPYDERFRNLVSWVLTLGLVVLWSFPVAFIGSLSNITSLCNTVGWLHWLCNTSTRLQDVIQGILPPVLLGLIFLILPMVLRLIGRYSGVPRVSEIELILMTRYYIFLVIHGFVVTTLSSGLTAAIPELSKDPGQAVTILTQNLPMASIFFMTYMVTTSLTSASGALLQVFDLILYYLKLFVWASTPRSVFDIRYTMSRPQFGTLFPNTTLLATIGLAYSIIAPVMTVLALLAFSVYWLAYKYLFLFTFDIPAAHETGGRFFPLAMNHVFIGLYVSQICLTGLFFLARNADDDPSSIPQGALMIILIVFTFFYHLLIRKSYAPLTMFIPLSMFDDEVSAQAEEERLLGGFSDVDRHLKQASSNPLIEDVANDVHHHNRSDSVDFQNSPGITFAPFATPGPPSEIGASPEGQKMEKQAFNVMKFEPLSITELRNQPPKNSPSSPAILPTIGPSNSNSRQSSMARAEEYHVEQGRTAFLHPAVWEKTRPIWIPEDPMGVAKFEMADMRRRNIPVSMEGAGMSASGKVFVTRSPPETAEVIEIERDRVEGIFAIPGAIGEVAKYAGGKIGEAVFQSAAIGKSAASNAFVSHHMRKGSNGSGRAAAGASHKVPDLTHGRKRSMSSLVSAARSSGSRRRSPLPPLGTLRQKFKKRPSSGDHGDPVKSTPRPSLSQLTELHSRPSEIGSTRRFGGPPGTPRLSDEIGLTASTKREEEQEDEERNGMSFEDCGKLWGEVGIENAGASGSINPEGNGFSNSMELEGVFKEQQKYHLKTALVTMTGSPMETEGEDLKKYLEGAGGGGDGNRRALSTVDEVEVALSLDEQMMTPSSILYELESVRCSSFKTCPQID